MAGTFFSCIPGLPELGPLYVFISLLTFCALPRWRRPLANPLLWRGRAVAPPSSSSTLAQAPCEPFLVAWGVPSRIPLPLPPWRRPFANPLLWRGARWLHTLSLPRVTLQKKRLRPIMHGRMRLSIPVRAKKTTIFKNGLNTRKTPRYPPNSMLMSR